jgi:hypothetical protein
VCAGGEIDIHPFIGHPEQGQKQLDPMAVAGKEEAVKLDGAGGQDGSGSHNSFLFDMGNG